MPLLTRSDSCVILGEGGETVTDLLAEETGLAVYTAPEGMPDDALLQLPAVMAAAGDRGFLAHGELASQYLKASCEKRLPPVDIVILLSGSVFPSGLLEDYLPLDADIPAIWLHADSDLLADVIGGGET